MTSSTGTQTEIGPAALARNPNNPRRYFNEERLDLLRTSIQEVGILVPLIVYKDPQVADHYVLMDGERRWRCSVDLALDDIPVNVIDAPTELENLLRMFNIHNVREDWPLISVALSLKEVMSLSGETGEKRLSQMTGLTRATVRRAKRLLSMPDAELELIQSEAHLDRTKQTHREDLYLEIESAESVLRNELPEVADDFTRPEIIRAFAQKAEANSIRAVTDFRLVGRLVKAADDDLVPRSTVVAATRQLISDPSLGPKEIYDDVAAAAYRQQSVQRKISLLISDLHEFDDGSALSAALREELTALREAIDQLLAE